MKKNYLLAALVSVLALSGCGGNSTSSSSAPASNSSTVISSSTVESTSSSSVAPAIPTVEDGVSTFALDYTVNYTVAASGDEFSVYVEDTEDFSEVYYYAESTNDGYYINKSGEVYYYYMNGFNKPVYNTVSKLETSYADSFKASIDVKSVFSDASWDLVSSDKNHVYFTEDAEVINTCVFLNDGIGYDSVESVEVTINNKGKVSAYTTYDASGEVVVSSEFKRIGTTYAVEYAPVLDDNMDKALVNRWVIALEGADTTLGAVYDMFEVFEDGTLLKYDKTEDGYAVPGETYSFVTPLGNGTYAFQNEAGDLAVIQSISGMILFATLDSETKVEATAYAISYYELMFLTAAEMAGYVVEAMTEDDEMYESCVSSLNAVGAYYVAEVDENGEALDLIIVTQYVNIPHMVEEFMEGDATLYNGCSLGGYIYANFAVTAAATNDSVAMMHNITNYLSPEYVAVDESRYIDVPEGATALDYLIAVMTTLGYSYNNSANPGAYAEDIQMIMDVNNSAGSEEPEEGDASTASLILMENGTSSHPVTTTGDETTEETPEEPARPVCTDVYVFHKGEQYACVVVFDTIIALWGQYGLSNVSTIGYGYFAVIGEIYGALTTWGKAQPAPQA